MGDLKHTKGPWKLYFNDKFYSIFGPDETSLNNREVKILDVVKDPIVLKETWERQLADARLIAAAPDMIEALITEYKKARCSPVDATTIYHLLPIIEKASGQKIEDILC